MTPPFKLAVELVEQDVRQQRRERAALRRPFLSPADDPARHHPGFEITTDQLEHSLVFDMTLHMGHQDVVVDPIKELLQIEFHAPTVPRRHMDAGGFDGFSSSVNEKSSP